MEKQLPLAITGSTAGKLSRGNSRGRTRTCDPPVNSRLLYQLSYSGRATLSAFSRQLSASRGGNIVRATRQFNRRDLADGRRPTADGSTAAPRAPYLPRS